MARMVEEITRGYPRSSSMDKSRKLEFLRAVKVMGEAAYRISPEFRQDTPQIPWDGIIALSNRLKHDYQDTDEDGAWVAPRMSILEIIAELDKLLSDG